MRFDDDFRVRGEAIEIHHVAGFAVDGQLRFEALQQSENGVAEFGGVWRLERQEHLERRRHRAMRQAQEGDFRRGRWRLWKIVKSAKDLAGGLGEVSRVKEVATIHKGVSDVAACGLAAEDR